MTAAIAAATSTSRRSGTAAATASSAWSWRILSVVLICGLLVPFVSPVWAAVLFSVGAGVSLTGTVVGMMARAPGVRPFLGVFAAAGGSFLVGIMVRPPDALSSGTASWAADAFTFAGYVGLFIFLTRMLHSTKSAPAAVVLDVVAATCSISLIAWVLLIDPALQTPGRSVTDGIRSVAYVAADVLLLAVLVQLAFRRTALVPASLLTIAGMLTLLCGDLTYAAFDAGWQVGVPERYWSLWYLLAFGLFGAMAMHPSLPGFLTPGRRLSWASERARFTVLFLALTVPVVMPVLQPPTGDGDQWFRVAASGLVVATVFVRLLMTAGKLSQAARSLRVAERVSRLRAERDSLTGLLNRATVLDRIDQRLIESDGALHLLYVDLDGFKPINDTWGHTVGDGVLVEVASRFQAALVPGELMGRVGGDEFIVLTNRDPRTLADRLRCALSDPFELTQTTCRTLTASIGLARANAGSDAEALMQQADVAMYSVKNAHRDGVAAFDEQMYQQVAFKTLMAEELRTALGTPQLSMVFQPIVDACDGQARGYEALLRWSSPSLGAVRPDQAIAAAEQANLMGPLGEWILAAAMTELSVRQAQTPDHQVFMSINISARQLEDDVIVGQVSRLLAQSGLDPGMIWLELSESAVLAGSSQAAVVADRLRDTGVQIALDDFGTGYAALTQIRQLRPEVVKIDRSFVSGDGDGLADESVVTAVVAMSHAINAVVVAEGIETVAQADHLRALGCDLFQGYLLGRPAPGSASSALPAKVIA